MYNLYIDFETIDPPLADTGSCYIWSDEFSIVCMGYAKNNENVQYTTSFDDMRTLLAGAHTLIAHNISYELGCLKWLGVDFKHKRLRDTLIGSKLDYNIRQSHSLEYLGKQFFNEEKTQDKLVEFALRAGLIQYPQKYYKTEDEDYKRKTEALWYGKIKKFVYQNLDKLPVSLVAEYCMQDVNICRLLDNLWLERLDKDNYYFWSDIAKVTTEMRHSGIRIDLEQAKKYSQELDIKINIIEREAKINGWWCNWRSNKALPGMLIASGVVLPKTDKGNYKTDDETLALINHPAVQLIRMWRKLKKAKKDFIDKLLNMNVNGRIYGEMKVLGAVATGRFSHKNPNLANFPKRDPLIGKMARSLFIPDDDEEWYSLDYSAQEPRFYVHFAIEAHYDKTSYKKQVYDMIGKKWVWDNSYSKAECPMILDLQKEYIDNPNLDSHMFNRNLIEKTTGVSLSRSDTKTFALGKAYGKGIKSTAEELGKDYEDIKVFFKAFEKASPYITIGFDLAKYYFTKKDGYITTVLGRKNYWNGQNYEAKNGYNYRIQGSGADQISLALMDAYYRYNIIPKTVVHDEINISGTKQDAVNLQKSMQNAIKLHIPTVAEIGSGKNWLEAK